MKHIIAGIVLKNNPNSIQNCAHYSVPIKSCTTLHFVHDFMHSCAVCLCQDVLSNWKTPHVTRRTRDAIRSYNDYLNVIFRHLLLQN